MNEPYTFANTEYTMLMCMLRKQLCVNAWRGRKIMFSTMHGRVSTSPQQFPTEIEVFMGYDRHIYARLAPGIEPIRISRRILKEWMYMARLGCIQRSDEE